MGSREKNDGITQASGFAWDPSMLLLPARGKRGGGEGVRPGAPERGPDRPCCQSILSRSAPDQRR